MKKSATLILLACFVLPAVSATAEGDEIDKQILGGWQLKMTTPDGEYRQPLVLVGCQYDRYAAWYLGEGGLQRMKNVQMKGDKLVGGIVSPQYPGMEITLEAQLKTEDTCEGVGRFKAPDGETGSWDFTGKRAALSSMGDATKWKVKFTTPDYEEYAATVAIFSKGDNYFGWYDGEDHKIVAHKVKIDGDQITVNMTAEIRDGTEVQLTFRGAVTGDETAGDVDFVMGSESGSGRFTAKQVQ